VALTMRNPLDGEKIAHGITKVSEVTGSGDGGDGQLGSILAGLLQNRPKAGERQTPAGIPDIFAASSTAAAATTQPAGNPLWEMLVVRGNNSEKRSFPLSDVDQNRGKEVEQAPSEQKKPAPAESAAPTPTAG
jgi:hypothetical protein